MDEIEELLTRGVDTIYPSREALEKVLRSGKKLRLYQGFDPTGTQLHIGHAVAIRKLRQFQDLGHEVIFLIGDGTGQAGDPSGKKTAREKFFTNEELRKNARDYVKQAGKIVRFNGPNPVKILYNGDWLNKLTLRELLDIAGHFSLQQMLERDLYQERLQSGVTLSLREFMYPLLQGYDSVAMNVDLELGGTDQTFNMLAGRSLIKAMLGKEKFVMTVPLLADAKGTKIGKTEKNVIALTDPPNEFYAKIMSLGDDAIVPCFTLLTDTPNNDIENMKNKMKVGENPMVFKKQLAHELTKQFNSQMAADAAERSWNDFQVQKKSTNIISKSISYAVEIILSPDGNLFDALGAAPINKSNTEIKRLLNSGSIDVNGVTLGKEDNHKPLTNGDIILVGKHTVLKIKK